MISVYSDGSSTGRSDKPGGWAFVIVRDGMPLLANYGGNAHTTNNIQELTGAIEGLKAVIANGWHTGNMIELVSDSEYVLKTANGTNHPQKNLELCEELVKAFDTCQARVRWCRGHSGDLYNERCDSLARQGKMEATNSHSHVTGG